MQYYINIGMSVQYTGQSQEIDGARAGFLRLAQTETTNSSESAITECVTTLFIFTMR